MIFWGIVAYAVIGFFVGRQVAVKCYEELDDATLAIMPALCAWLLWPLFVLGAAFWYFGVKPVVKR